MVAYLTLDAVNAILGSNWAANGDENMTITMANAWLSSQKLPEFVEVPANVILAGALIAKEYVAGNMFQARNEGVVIKKSVKAGDVASSKEYASGSDGQPMSQGEIMALALIEPYLLKASGFNIAVNRG